MLEDERKNAKKHFKTPDIAQCRGYNMGWIRADIWDRLIDEHWNTPSWKRKSEINKRNRLTEKEGSITKHTGGSVPFTVHAYRMTKERNRPVTFKEVFDRCHKRQKGHGDYVDLKSKAVSESYSCSLEQKYGPDGDTQPEFDPAAWCEAIGGIKTTRTHVYGFGTASRGKQIFDPSYSPPETSSSACGPSIVCPRSSSVEVDELRHEMNERLSRQDDKMDTIVQSNADLKDAILKMSQLLTSITSMHSQNAGVPPQASYNAPVLSESSDSESESDDDYGD